MRAALWLGRFPPNPAFLSCYKQTGRPPTSSSAIYLRRLFSFSSKPFNSKYAPAPCRSCRQHHAGKSQHYHKFQWRSHQNVSGSRRTFSPYRGTSTLLLAVILTPAAFLELAENGADDAFTTAESEMLAASHEEARARRRIPDNVDGMIRLCRSIYIFVDQFVVEPVATALRFFHLLVIFVPVFVTVPAIWIGPRVRSRDGERTGTLWWYGFLVRAMERGGAAFIKLGQWAASRSDIFPPELCAQMSSLHSNAPAHSLNATKRIISNAFNMPFEDIFEEFDEKPLGVGAIAQVYKAKLRPDLVVHDQLDVEDKPLNIAAKFKKNVDTLVKISPRRVPSSYVAIKVLHPRVQRIVRRDLKIMDFFARMINAIPSMEWFSFPDEVKQFGHMMRLQLDLRIEAANLQLFRERFKSRTTAWFPYPYTEYTTREVLVEEFAQGIPLAVFLESGGGVYQQGVAREGLDAFLHMLLIDNFVHADLHPGNIMVRFYKPGQLDLSFKTHRPSTSAKEKCQVDVTESVLNRLRPYQKDPEKWNAVLSEIEKEGYRPQLIFIDTGLVTQLNSLNRRNFLDLFRAVAEFDGYRSGQLMVERCRQPGAVIDPEIFALKMQHLVLAVKGRTFALGNVKIGDVLSQVLYMVRAHHVRLEGDFVNVVVSILLLEGIGRSLDPELDLFKSALPILRQLGSGTTILKSVREGDTSMLKVWVGLEARTFLQASIENVEMCVKYDLLSPNI
ncbi:ABC1 family protein [Paracoccidioides lutzii Pb01]|uniref:ABC1 family protein n=1 Tax=Paracoccidioides lutzii (strain ATCC MYA-826 / Pb01) TaxID=502779 RepID=C1GSH1_PARBA|nr:ABC1 family protein [Paracoccidioides lutzii Pb01]EEH39004.2 ABC1 family protein [Paracoccidioides lutzii Pb01]